METLYFAGGCLWGVQAYIKTLPGVLVTEAGRANGATECLDGPYDGYAECVKTTFDEPRVSVEQLMDYFFEIIDPYSLNKQGADVGKNIEQACIVLILFIYKRRKNISRQELIATRFV